MYKSINSINLKIKLKLKLILSNCKKLLSLLNQLRFET
jgi:hypothetical protein